MVAASLLQEHHVCAAGSTAYVVYFNILKIYFLTGSFLQV